MMMMTFSALVNTLVLTIYFEHADAACTDLSTFPATRHDRHFWPTFSDQHFLLILSTFIFCWVLVSWKQIERKEGDFIRKEKSIPLQDIQGQFVLKKSVFWLTRKLVFGQQIDFQMTGIHPSPFKEKEDSDVRVHIPLEKHILQNTLWTISIKCQIQTNTKMIISLAGRLGEAPLRACVFLWAPESLEGW